MSLRVLIVPEDPINNGYILKPLVARMLQECGKPNAKVDVLTNPRARGYENAKKLLEQDVLSSYGRRCELLLFLPDRDGTDRVAEFERLETVAADQKVTLLCCAAVEEVEAWLLAGHTEKLSKSWADVRSDRSIKENTFAGFLASQGDARRAGGGRDSLMEQTLRNYRGLLARCDELGELHQRVQQLVQGWPAT